MEAEKDPELTSPQKHGKFISIYEIFFSKEDLKTG